MYLFLLLLGGCADESGRSSLLVHEGLRAPIEVELDSVGALWTIGVLEGSPEQEFGKIVGATIDQFQNIHLLDELAQRVRVHSEDGGFLYAYGRSGQGPGEFADPIAILHDGVEDLYVLDRINGLSRFRVESQAVEHLKTVSLGLIPSDLCLSEGRLFVLGLGEGDDIHEFTRDGRLLRSFGGPFGPPGILRPVMVDGGKIACLPEQGMIVASTGILPEIHAYGIRDGQLLWTDSLPGFRQIRIWVDPSQRGYSMLPPADDQGFDRIHVWRPVGGRGLLVQSRRVITDVLRGTEEEVIDTWFLDGLSGACMKKTQAIPLLLAEADHWAIAVQEELFPTVSAVRIPYAIHPQAPDAH